MTKIYFVVCQQQSKMSDRFHKVLSDMPREVDLQHFERFVLLSSSHATELYNNIKECKTQGLPRFNVWRMLLEVMPVKGDWSLKKQALQAGRQKWIRSKQEARTGIIKPSPSKQPVNIPKNPLMKMVSKPEKKQVETDDFLKSEIKKDVERTYQQMVFFQDKEIDKLLSDILFVWCKLNSDISYKQGMNEVLASIVYVYFKEAVPGNFQASSELEEKYLFLNSVQYAEADIYMVFQKIMEIQKDMFKENLDEEMKGYINPNTKNNTPLLQRILTLIDQRLKATDLELFRIIKLQDVKTKTFLLRWIRCMHTRQFGLFNSLYIWDSMFLQALESPVSKSKKQYQFIDAMCLAMFIYMRAVVQTRQTANEIMQVYSKYPPLEGQYLFEVIRLAWSVVEELRSQASNEDTDKSKKLGLIEKANVSPPVKAKKSERADYEVHAKNVQSPSNSKGAITLPPDPKNTSKPEIQKRKQNGSATLEAKPEPPVGTSPANRDKSKTSEDVFFKPNTSSKKQEETVSNGPVELQQSQLRSMIQTLKQSITLNTDTQSRALSNKVLKMLEGKARK